MSLCSRGPFVFSLLQRPLAQSQGLYFSTHSVHFRNLAEIFHADRRPDVQLDLQAGEELLNIPRKPPVIKPCPKWTQSIKKTLDGPMSAASLSDLCEESPVKGSCSPTSGSCDPDNCRAELWLFDCSSMKGAFSPTAGGNCPLMISD